MRLPFTTTTDTKHIFLWKFVLYVELQDNVVSCIRNQLPTVHRFNPYHVYEREIYLIKATAPPNLMDLSFCWYNTMHL